MLKIQDFPEILTLRQVAKYLSISVLTLKRWGKKGDIKILRINSRGDRRIRKEDLIAFISSRL